MATSLGATRDIVEMLADNFRDSEDKAIVVVGSVACQLIADEQPIGYQRREGWAVADGPLLRRGARLKRHPSELCFAPAR